MVLRIISALVSLAIHGSVAAAMLLHIGARLPEEAALEAGAGEDMMVIEQGVAIEGMDKGTEVASVEAVEATPPVVQPVKPVEEVKPVEDVQHVIASDAGPEQENVVRELEPEKVEEKKVQEVVAAAEPPVAAVEEKIASGKAQQGGDVTAFNAYRGKLFSLISKKKVNPRSRLTGRVEVRMTIAQTGELVSAEVSKSSGSKVLDDAAIASVNRAQPFPPVASNVADGPVVIVAPFNFTVAK